MNSLHHDPKKIRLVLVILAISALFFGICAAAGPDATIPGPSVGNETAGNATVYDIVTVTLMVTATPELITPPTLTVTETPVVTPTSPFVTTTAGLTNGTNAPAAPALAPVNPKYLEYKNRTKTAGIQKMTSRRSATALTGSISTSHTFVEGEVPSPVDLTHTRGQHITMDSGSATVHTTGLDGDGYSASFDLRTSGNVSPVKDQGSAGSCWAFATYGSLESTLLSANITDFRDLSENNMKNVLASTYTDGFDRGWIDGGHEWMSTAYLTRWTGAINESDDPYSDSSGVSPSGQTPVKHVQNVYFLPARSNSTDNDNIKEALANWGAVKASIYWASSYFNDTSDAFYNGDTSGSNHAITIVGWDDTYSASNFASAPAGDGAFIVKNSWGTAWGDAGYFYVSYYDLSIGDRCVVFFAEPTTNYDRIYSYDPLGWVYDYGYSSTSARFANIYTSQSAETLKAVGFYTTDSNVNYIVTIYRSPNSGPINTGGSASTASGTLGSPGYHTVTVPDVALTAGQKYSIVVSVTNPTYQYPVAIEYPDPGYSSHATAHAGESYVSSDGGATWVDLTTIYADTNVCLKGYSMAVPTTAPVAAFSGIPASGTAPLTVPPSDGSDSAAPAAYAISSTNSVNVGGNSAISEVAVTGNGISGVIVTGTVVTGPGQGNLPAPGTPYQYLDITPARYTAIENAVISFSVPRSWLDEHHLSERDVVMYHLSEKSWNRLPTSFVRDENGRVHYSAVSSSFSLFAIVGEINNLSNVLVQPQEQNIQSNDVKPAIITPVMTLEPATTQTIAVPVLAPSSQFPVMTLVLLCGACLGIVAASVLIRSWWIRRQNPALFREHD